MLDRLGNNLPVTISYSADSTVCDDPQEETDDIPIEFINRLNPSGMPPHILRMKEGAMIMLLRNLYPHLGFLLFRLKSFKFSNNYQNLKKLCNYSRY